MRKGRRREEKVKMAARKKTKIQIEEKGGKVIIGMERKEGEETGEGGKEREGGGKRERKRAKEKKIKEPRMRDGRTKEGRKKTEIRVQKK